MRARHARSPVSKCWNPAPVGFVCRLQTRSVRSCCAAGARLRHTGNDRRSRAPASLTIETHATSIADRLGRRVQAHAVRDQALRVFQSDAYQAFTDGDTKVTAEHRREIGAIAPDTPGEFSRGQRLLVLGRDQREGSADDGRGPACGIDGQARVRVDVKAGSRPRRDPAKAPRGTAPAMGRDRSGRRRDLRVSPHSRSPRPQHTRCATVVCMRDVSTCWESTRTASFAPSMLQDLRSVGAIADRTGRSDPSGGLT